MKKLLVAKGKGRYSTDGFNVDLNYITERIIAMDFPLGSDAQRHTRKEVLRLLETHHINRFRVYNLSQESYDMASFHNRVVMFPFEDQTPPTFELMESFCLDVEAWFSKNSKNVVVIHSKDTEGRTATMVAAYLIRSYKDCPPDLALEIYGRERADKGNANASQRRYLKYYEELLKLGRIPVFPTQHISHMKITTNTPFDSPASVPQIMIYDRFGALLFGSKAQLLQLAEDGATIPCKNVPVCGDARLVVLNQEVKLAQIWFNTAFVKKSSLLFDSTQIDYLSDDDLLKSINFMLEVAMASVEETMLTLGNGHKKGVFSQLKEEEGKGSRLGWKKKRSSINGIVEDEGKGKEKERKGSFLKKSKDKNSAEREKPIEEKSEKEKEKEKEEDKGKEKEGDKKGSVIEKENSKERVVPQMNGLGHKISSESLKSSQSEGSEVRGFDPPNQNGGTPKLNSSRGEGSKSNSSEKLQEKVPNGQVQQQQQQEKEKTNAAANPSQPPAPLKLPVQVEELRLPKTFAHRQIERDERPQSERVEKRDRKGSVILPAHRLEEIKSNDFMRSSDDGSYSAGEVLKSPKGKQKTKMAEFSERELYQNMKPKPAHIPSSPLVLPSALASSGHSPEPKSPQKPKKSPKSTSPRTIKENKKKATKHFSPRSPKGVKEAAKPPASPSPVLTQIQLPTPKSPNSPHSSPKPNKSPKGSPKPPMSPSVGPMSPTSSEGGMTRKRSGTFDSALLNRSEDTKKKTKAKKSKSEKKEEEGKEKEKEKKKKKKKKVSKSEVRRHSLTLNPRRKDVDEYGWMNGGEGVDLAVLRSNALAYAEKKNKPTKRKSKKKDGKKKKREPTPIIITIEDEVDESSGTGRESENGDVESAVDSSSRTSTEEVRKKSTKRVKRKSHELNAFIIPNKSEEKTSTATTTTITTATTATETKSEKVNEQGATEEKVDEKALLRKSIGSKILEEKKAKSEEEAKRKSIEASLLKEPDTTATTERLPAAVAVVAEGEAEKRGSPDKRGKGKEKEALITILDLDSEEKPPVSISPDVKRVQAKNNRSSGKVELQMEEHLHPPGIDIPAEDDESMAAFAVNDGQPAHSKKGLVRNFRRLSVRLSESIFSLGNVNRLLALSEKNKPTKEEGKQKNHFSKDEKKSKERISTSSPALYGSAVKKEETPDDKKKKTPIKKSYKGRAQSETPAKIAETTQQLKGAASPDASPQPASNTTSSSSPIRKRCYSDTSLSELLKKTEERNEMNNKLIEWRKNWGDNIADPLVCRSPTTGKTSKSSNSNTAETPNDSPNSFSSLLSATESISEEDKEVRKDAHIRSIFDEEPPVRSPNERRHTMEVVPTFPVQPRSINDRARKVPTVIKLPIATRRRPRPKSLQIGMDPVPGEPAEEEGLLYTSDVDWFLENASQQFAPQPSVPVATQEDEELRSKKSESTGSRTPRTPRPASGSFVPPNTPTGTQQPQQQQAIENIVNRPGRAMTITGDGTYARPPFLPSGKPKPKKSTSNEDISLPPDENGPMPPPGGRPRSTSIAIPQGTRTTRSATTTSYGSSPPYGGGAISGLFGSSNPDGGGGGGMMGFKYPFRTRQRRSQSMYQPPSTPPVGRSRNRTGAPLPFLNSNSNNHNNHNNPNSLLPLPPSLEESTPLSDFSDREKRLWHRISARLSPDLGDDVMEGIIWDEYMEKKRRLMMLEKIKSGDNLNQQQPPEVNNNNIYITCSDGSMDTMPYPRGLSQSSLSPTAKKKEQPVTGMRRAYKQAKGKIKRVPPVILTSRLNQPVPGKPDHDPALGRRGQSDSNLQPLAAKVPLNVPPLVQNNKQQHLQQHQQQQQNLHHSMDWEDGEQETLAKLIMGGSSPLLPPSSPSNEHNSSGNNSPTTPEHLRHRRGQVNLRASSPGLTRLHTSRSPRTQSSPPSPNRKNSQFSPSTSPPITPPSPITSPPTTPTTTTSTTTTTLPKYTIPPFSSFSSLTSPGGRAKSSSTSNLTSSLSTSSTKNPLSGRSHYRNSTGNNPTSSANPAHIKEMEEIKARLRAKEKELEEALKVVEQKKGEINELKQQLWEKMNTSG